MITIQQELEDQLVNQREQVLVIVGAGVSIASTNRKAVASWKGLLRNGIEYCSRHCADLPPRWASRMTAQLTEGDTVEVISVADDVSTRLGFPNGGEYRKWLAETAGSLKADRPRLIQALGDWNVQIATTNYDGLVEEVTGRNAITWKALRVF